ncbi:MAG: extracellular solute-binding protein [Fimbriimonadaceae bacterium]|nr:extracellular solute-binding protein [Fimbriimonadaceae bacterium]QYK54942.1 MAG: extracellular solute-binding protein [Fimbriimonadaceae bacterium]
MKGRWSSANYPAFSGFKAKTFLCLVFGLAFSFASAKTTIRISCWDGDQALRVMRQTIADFEKANPAIKVKLENVVYGEYAHKLLAQYAADAAPDVAMMEPPIFQSFARRGALLPLDDLIANTPGFQLQAYYTPIVEAHRYQHKLYVLPRDVAPIGLIYYNKRLFRQAGLPDPDGSWTWDFEPREELREKCFTWCLRQLTKRDANGKVVQWAFTPGWPAAFIDTMVYSQGAQYADDAEQPTRLLYDDPRVVASFNFYQRSTNKEGWIPRPLDISTVLQSSSTQLFIAQKVAMFQSGIWEVPSLRKAIVPGTPTDFDWDITLAPGYIDPKTGTVNRSAPTGGSGYAIVSSTKHREAAWKLVQWLSGPPAMKLMAQAGIAQPAIQELALSEYWLPPAGSKDPNLRPHNRIVTDAAVKNVVFKPSADYWSEVNSFVETKFDPILSGQMKTEDGLADGQAQATKRLVSVLAERSREPFNWPIAIVSGLIIVCAIVFWLSCDPIEVSKTARSKRETRVAYLFLTPWIIGLVALTLGPMLLSLLMSTADWDIITPARWTGLGNYQEAFFQDQRFWTALRVTGIYTAVAVPLGLIVSLAMALLLNTGIRAMPAFRTIFYLPALASPVATALIFRKVFQPEGGLLNTIIYGPRGEFSGFGVANILSNVTGSTAPANWLGDEKLALPALIIMSVWGAGAGMIILLAGLQGIPGYYYEASRLDGASPWQQLKSITVPLLSPALFFTLITGVIASFQVFTQAFVMTTGGPNDATLFYILHLFRQAFGSLRMGYASALAWILFAIIVAFTILQFQLNKYVYYEGGDK